MPKVTVAGYYGFGNTGDEAILESIIVSLRRYVPGVDLTVLSADPRATSAQHNVRAIQRFSPLAVASAIASSDLLLFGGGSLLQDVTSLRSLMYYSFILAAAQSMGKPTMVYANGFGPVRSALGKAMVRGVLRRTTVITLRDAASAEELDHLGIRLPNTRVTADPVFALDPIPPANAERVLRCLTTSAPRRPLVGISLRPWHSAEDLAAKMASAADLLVDRLGATVVLIPMQPSCDAPLAAEVASTMRRPSIVLTRKSDVLKPREVMGVIGMMDAVLGMRLHSLIFSVATGVPAAGVSYDPKIDAFLRAAGCPNLGTPGELDPESVVTSVESLLDPANGHSERLLKKREEFRRLALENARMAAELLTGM